MSGFRGLVATGLVGMLVACGGGSGSDDDATLDSVVARGVITEFGSVVMNGVRYETENSRIVSADDGSLIIDNPSDAELRQYLGLGMVIELKGSSMDDVSGVAGTISVDSELVGPIDSIDSALRFIVVNAQTVTVTDDTIIDDSIIEAACGCPIANDTRFGDLGQDLDFLFAGVVFVEVNGFPTDGGLQATRIEDVDNRDRIIVEIRNAGEVEVKGLVRNPSATQFEINGLTVFYDAGDLDDDFGPGGLQADQFVEVKGSKISATEMDASEIELEHGDLSADDADTDRFEIEGVILQVIPDNSGPGGVIVIGQNEIRVDDIAPFVGMENLRVEIKAMLLSDGSLAISRLHDESEDTVRTEDLLVSGDGTDFTTRLGLNLVATGRTRQENEGVVDFAGARIEARGFPLDGGVLWTRIEVEADDDNDCRLRGPAADISGTAESFSFTIAGVTIDVSQVSDNNFEGANGLSIGRQQFFTLLDEGKLVQASANSSGCVSGTLSAREVEFQGAGGDDGGAGGGGLDDGVNDNEIVGLVSNVTDDSFVIGGRTITVDDATLIDDSMIEAVRGSEVAGDLPLGEIDETLPQLLAATPLVEVQVNADDLALSIEDL